MNKMKKIGLAISTASLAPLFAFAQNSHQVFGILGIIKGIFNVLIPILITLGVVYFIWGVIEYVIEKDEKGKESARHKMIYGIIGLFVIVSIWGLVGFLGNTLGIGQGGDVPLPCVPDPNGLGC